MEKYNLKNGKLTKYNYSFYQGSIYSPNGTIIENHKIGFILMYSDEDFTYASLFKHGDSDLLKETFEANMIPNIFPLVMFTFNQDEFETPMGGQNIVSILNFLIDYSLNPKINKIKNALINQDVKELTDAFDEIIEFQKKRGDY